MVNRSLHTLTDTFKNLHKIEMREEAKHGCCDDMEYSDRRCGCDYGREKMIGNFDELMNDAFT